MGASLSLPRQVSKVHPGHIPSLGLADAREGTRDVLRLVAKGTNPVSIGNFSGGRKPSGETNTFEVVARKFVELYCKTNQPRLWQETEATIARYLLPDVGHSPIRFDTWEGVARNTR